MEESSDIELKYQKLASEYSKVRTQASVLKKGVIDEQIKNAQLKEIIRDHEQKLRKHDQEMESLMFRNEQLMKRISVLQQELQMNCGKKNKGKPPENTYQSDFSVLVEELHKKVIENAQLASTMADKDMEIERLKSRIDWFDVQLNKSQKENTALEDKCKDLEKIKLLSRKNSDDEPKQNNDKGQGDYNKNTYWQQEAERWRTECEVLRSRPDTNEKLAKYYESQITELLESKQLAMSENSSLWAENQALEERLEHLILEKNEFSSKVDKHIEEMKVTNDNYKSQLDAMTEHLAAQNEKITQQCDEIQMLKHKMSAKK